MIKAQDEFFKVKEENIRLQEKLKSSLTEGESQKLKQQINILKVENAKILPELESYKGLHVALSNKNRAEETIVGKIKAERDKYYDLVK